MSLVLDVGAGGRGTAAASGGRGLIGEQLGDPVGGRQLRRRVTLQTDDGRVGAEVEEDPADKEVNLLSSIQQF